MMRKNAIRLEVDFIKDIKCELCTQKAEYDLKVTGFFLQKKGYYCHNHYSAFVDNKLDI